MKFRAVPFFSALAVVILAAVPCSGQDRPIRSEARTDWERNLYILSLEADLPDEGANLPSARLSMERAIAGELPAIFRERVSAFPVDSFTTVGERIPDAPELRLRLEDLAGAGTRNLSRLSVDLSRFSMEYRYSIFPQLASLFVRHSTPYAPPELLEYVPTTRYTGLVIDARGLLPVHGSEDRRPLTPSLFPRLFDEQMRLLLEKEMMDPEILIRQGPAAFTSGTDESAFRSRIGDRPLRTMATGLFGKNATDPMLPLDAARRLLSRPENRRLLQEGRILIICDLPGQP